MTTFVFSFISGDSAIEPDTMTSTHMPRPSFNDNLRHASPFFDISGAAALQIAPHEIHIARWNFAIQRTEFAHHWHGHCAHFRINKNPMLTNYAELGPGCKVYLI